MESETSQKVSKVQKFLSNRRWRITGGKLYKIVNKKAESVFFEPNKFQKIVLLGMWYLNVILKARQLGMSTFIAIFGLDYCLFNDNVSFGVIDQTIDDAKKKLEKIKHAYENIPEEYKPFIPKIVVDNKEELKFDNGSTIYVGTSHRGGTLNILWVSEHAIIGSKSKEKETDIRSGALNTVEAGQIIFLESTAAGSEGDFYKICQEAEKALISGEELSKLDFKFFFFPWWDHPDYSLPCPDAYVFSKDMVEYFEILEGSIRQKLTRNQKYWYTKKRGLLQEDVKTEFPGTSKEAFEATDRDKYYQQAILRARAENRICEFPIAEGVEVDTWWDLGRSDYTSIIFTQRIGKELRIVDFVEGWDEHISFFSDILKRKGYLYGKMYLPHDAKAEVLQAEKSCYKYLVDAKFNCEIVEKLGVESGINEVRRILKSCWFRRSTTEKLVEHLEKYKKKWVASVEQYIGQVHDEHSHAADAMRYLAVGIPDADSLKSGHISQSQQIKNDLSGLGQHHEDDDLPASNPFGY